MTVHELKTWPGMFEAVVRGRKLHEIRLNDRGFRVGDQLLLREWDPAAGTAEVDNGYTGRRQLVEVVYMTDGEQWGLKPGYCVMSVERRSLRSHA